MTDLLLPVKALAREAGDAARAALWRGALVMFAGAIGAVGFGFFIFAGYMALRLTLAPEIAALVTGAALMLLAVIVLLLSGAKRRDRRPNAPPATTQSSPAPSQPTDPATLAVFTTAFVIGRILANRRRH